MKRVLMLLNVFLVALILWVAVGITVTWRDSRVDTVFSGQETDPVEAASELPGTRLRDLRAFSLIAQKDIFSTVREKAPAKAPSLPEEDIRVTDLNLRLHGTVTGEEEASYAIIRDGASGEQRLYFTNDFVMGAKVERILSDRVILSLDGQLESLPLRPEPKGGAGVAAQKRVPGKARQRDAPNRRVRKRPPAS